MSRLLSSTILHRHGSRGPGASELSPFSQDNPIYSQWQEDEVEVLSSAGRAQIVVLGAWFAQRYVKSGLLEASGRTHWRCSKSDRALESGYDFVKGFNDSVGSQAAGPEPLPYDVDADNYFRPWKVFKKEASIIKNKIDTDQNWSTKASENEEFLQHIFQKVKCLPSVLEKNTKALWCTTYLHALREVETFWPSGARDEFCKALSAETSEQITALALWVWEQRFLHCGFNCEMGGRISVDLVESALNSDYSLNIFSGHDYTLLSVLAALKLVDSFEKPTGFGAYLLLEVWVIEGEQMMKVIYNADPFKCSGGDGVDMTSVNQDNEEVLCEVAVSELLALVQELREQISRFPPAKELKSQSSGEIDLLS